MRLPTKAGLHDEIVRVSIQLGSELGEEGLTMRAIAARLGVSATALYQHFESKAAILQEIRFLGIRLLQDAQRSAFELQDAAERITELAKRYIEFARSNPWLYKVLFQEENVDWSNLTEEQRKYLLIPLEQARDNVELAKQQGSFRPDLDANHTAMLLWASLHGLASLLISGRISERHPAYPVPDREAFVSDFVETLVSTFRRLGPIPTQPSAEHV